MTAANDATIAAVKAHVAAKKPPVAGRLSAPLCIASGRRPSAVPYLVCALARARND